MTESYKALEQRAECSREKQRLYAHVAPSPRYEPAAEALEDSREDETDEFRELCVAAAALLVIEM